MLTDYIDTNGSASLVLTSSQLALHRVCEVLLRVFYTISMDSEHLDFSSLLTTMLLIEIRMHKTKLHT